MPLPRVTGVVWWEMQLSHYKAVFRRGREAGYTKDLLQAPKAIEDVLRQMFAGDPPYEPITYQWPGGTFQGKIYPVSDRLEVGQWTAAGAPGPWRIGDPSSDALITLRGDPEAAIPGAADAQWEDLEQLEPWLVMVQLDNSQTEIHLRAYLGAPPPDLLEADLERVPGELRQHMRGRGGLAGNELPELWFDPENFRDPWRMSPEDVPSDSVPPPTPPPDAPIGADYEPADERATSAAPEPFEVDPDARDRATRAHAVTQNALAAAVEARGGRPLRPTGEPNYDLAWEESDGSIVVAEVKSIRPQNVERQLRLGLGQVLRYRSLLQQTGKEVRALVALSGKPHDDRWRTLCAELGVGLIWLPDLQRALDQWLSGSA